MAKPDYRSPEAAEYRRLYKTPEWKALRAEQLRKQPLCERHLARGLTVAADTVNHREPHKGDRALFFDPTNVESTCKPCHDGPIQAEERKGYSGAVDADGWPSDPRHPANRRGG